MKVIIVIISLAVTATLMYITPSKADSPSPNVPIEIDEHKTATIETPKGQPLILINLNLNIGHNDVSTIAPAASFGKKVKVEKVKIHIMRLQRKHDMFRALIQDEDGTSEWKDIMTDGLKYLPDDDTAWHYREYDVFLNGKIVSKERVISVHRINFDSVLNAPDGAFLP